jgi:hypothetical protein
MTETPPGGYDRAYDQRYDGLVADDGWSVRLTTREDDARWVGDALLGVDIQPEHTALWDGEIEVAPVFDPATYRFGTMDIYRDGGIYLRCVIDSAPQADGGTITITGRERQGMALLDGERTVTYERQRLEDAIRQFWSDETPFEATVHDPPDNPVEGLTVRSARTPAAFEELLKSRTRDAKGRFVEEEGGTAPNFAPTDPLQITDRGVELRQTNWVPDATTRSRTEGTVTTNNDDGDAQNGQSTTLSGEGALVAFDIETGHDIPELNVAPRWRATGSAGDTTVSISIDDETVNTASAPNAMLYGPDFAWARPGDFSAFTVNDTIDAGEHTVTIEHLGGGDDIHVDLVSINDARFGYGFDNNLDPDLQLTGPQLYPASFDARFEAIEPGIDVSDVHVTAEFSGADEDTAIRVATSDDGTVHREQTQPTQTHDVALSGDVPTATIHARIARTGQRTGNTPTTGYTSQALESLSVDVDGDGVAVIHESGRTYDGSTLDIAQALHEDAGYHFALDHGRADGALRVESFRRGDPQLARGLPSEAVITDRETDDSTEGYANRITVIGADYPRGIRRSDDPRRFDATVEDAGAIRNVGVHALTIHDDSLETHAACRSRARSELRARLDEDSRGGAIDTTPALVEPGYPYRVPAISMTDRERAAPTLADVPAGETRRVDADEFVTVRGTLAVAGTLVVDGTVVVFSEGTMTGASDGQLIADATTGAGTIKVRDSGMIVVHEVSDDILTCESWSLTESAGDASASGEFGRISRRIAGGDRATVLGLLAGD